MNRSRWWLGAALALAVFLAIAAGNENTADRAILLWAETLRTPWLTRAAVILTTLGSNLVVTIAATLGVVLLLTLRQPKRALHLVVASLGASVLLPVVKNLAHRQRPTVIPRLIEVSGFSFPSGHALFTAAIYLTIGLIAGRRALLAAAAVAFTVAATRVYLGVHYPSDVAGGLSLGAAWALLVAGYFSGRFRYLP